MVLAVQVQTPTKAARAVKAAVVVVAVTHPAPAELEGRAGAVLAAVVAVLRGSTSQQVLVVMAVMVML